MFGLEQQTRKKRVIGSGLTATLGTSPSGEEESPITKRMKMVPVRTVQPFQTTKPPVTKIGLTLHAIIRRGISFAQEQYVQMQVLNLLV